jgi:hypothetical protein
MAEEGKVLFISEAKANDIISKNRELRIEIKSLLSDADPNFGARKSTMFKGSGGAGAPNLGGKEEFTKRELVK